MIPLFFKPCHSRTCLAFLKTTGFRLLFAVNKRTCDQHKRVGVLKTHVLNEFREHHRNLFAFHPDHTGCRGYRHPSRHTAFKRQQVTRRCCCLLLLLTVVYVGTMTVIRLLLRLLPRLLLQSVTTTNQNEDSG